MQQLIEELLYTSKSELGKIRSLISGSRISFDEIPPVFGFRGVPMCACVSGFFASSFFYCTVLLCVIGHAEDKRSATQKKELTPQQQEIARLIETIDDDIDELHPERSAKTHALARIGVPALEPLLEQMLVPKPNLRIQTAIRLIIKYDLSEPNRVREFWQTVGSLNYETSKEERIKVTQNIRDWYKNREEKSTPVKP